MAVILSAAILQDEIAVSVAQVLASANRKAKELGVDLKESLITVSQHLANGVGAGVCITGNAIMSDGEAAI